jgi:hypothetical protein
MPDAGFVDLKIRFPDPVTDRGRAVNTIDLKVLSSFNIEIDTFGIDDLECVETVLEGVYYVRRNYDVSDPSKTPGAFVTLNYQATIGTSTTNLMAQKVSFRPAIGDVTSGILLQWAPPEVVEKERNTVDPLFYEVRRVDERFGLSDRAQTQFVPETHTTAFWPFDADFDDEVADPADLVATGVVEHVNGGGIIGSAARFYGNGWLSASNPTKLSYAADQDFSLSAWVMVTPLITSGLVAGKIASATGQGYGIYIDKVGQEFRPSLVINGPVNAEFVQFETNLNDAQWHHLVATFDRDGYARLYVDGVEVASVDISSTANVAFTTEDFYVGGNAANEVFTGMIDEVIAFDRVLTWIDVEKLYNETYGIPVETILGRTNFLQFVDTDFQDPHQMRHYKWVIYRAYHVQAPQPAGADYKMVIHKTITVKEVDFVDAPMCFVEGRVRLPTDQYAEAAIAKFFVAPWDRGQVVHDRILSRDQWWADIDRFGRFGAFLIQDAVVVCHIPAAHIQWRFVVPRQDKVTIQELLAQGKIEKQKFRINL